MLTGVEGHDLPNIHEFNITRLNFHEVNITQEERGMAADASVSLMNPYPVKFEIPPLGFDVLVPNCFEWQDNLRLANATTDIVEVKPKGAVNVNVSGVVRQLSSELTLACPGTHSSPLDALVGSYIEGKDTTIYVRGSDAPSADTPGWVADLLKSLTVPLPVPGHSFDNLIKNFSLTNVHFGFPSPFAEPDSPEGMPKISANIKVLVGLPKEMNFPIDVDRVRADADIFYHGKKLGVLDLRQWQEANATKVEDKNDGGAPALLVESVVDQAPLKVTDDDVFTEVIEALVFSENGAVLNVEASVDVNTVTALGEHVIRQIPAKGKVFIKPVSGGGGGGNGMSRFNPKIGSLKILDTTESSILLQVKVNITNPTPYSANVPYVDIKILNNDTVLGNATARNVSVVPGNNSDIVVEALWKPDGEGAMTVGRNLLSQYISGYNTTLTLRTHESSIPSQPSLGKALSKFEVEIATPKLHPPKDPSHGDEDEDEDDKPHFIKDATVLPAFFDVFHL